MAKIQRTINRPQFAQQHALTGLGTRIALARKVRGLTQAELARSAGIGISTVAALEAGSEGVALGNLAKALSALDLLSDLEHLANPRDDDAVVAFAMSKFDVR